MTTWQFWLDPQFWPYLVMPIGGSFIGLMCWLFLFPREQDGESGERKSR